MYRIKNIVLFVIMTFAFCFAPATHAFSGEGYVIKGIAKVLGRIEGALPESKIEELVEIISKTGSLKNATKVIGEMKLSNELLEDTFMRILMKQNKVSKEEAAELFQNLSGISGFRSALSKIAGNNPMQLKGHLHELRLANAAKKQGFEILEVGKKFDDEIKSGITDIDVLFQKGGKYFAAEVKNYDSTIPTSTVLGDAETLLQYAKSHDNFIPVFFFTKEPPAIVIKLLGSKNIQLIVGNAEEQAIQLAQLAKVMK